ncbi:hypothetical protein WDW89_04830 [Deltaproteobacteria bacterium TL4]
MNNLQLMITILMVLISLAVLPACNEGEISQEGNTTDLISKGVFTKQKTVAPGAQCLSGGVEVYSGIDENNNGTLDTSEIDVTEVICNGDKSLVDVMNEPAGANCAAGRCHE